MVYSIHIKEYGQHVAAFVYIGGTIGVTFAGDFFSLFVFWELMAVSSVFLIWYAKNESALKAGFRYLMVHLVGGCILLAGIMIHVSNTGSIFFDKIEFQGLGPILILIGFILNAAVPPFNAWLPDAYPQGTVTGSVIMTAFTTKSAVYVLARVFPGVELLVWLGAIMAIYGIIFAIIENNIRRLLAYHIISQVGYMVCGVGLGTEMALNGSTAHAFCHILYKALLFMGAGAVLQMTGTAKITDLEGRGLYKKMPITLALYMVGALSISGAPLFNGFISKSMVVAAAGGAHRPVIEILLHLASVGTFLSVGLKLPWGTWFGKAEGPVSEIEAKEPPKNMLIAMALTALACIVTGIFPKILYSILPYPVNYHPYTGYHVIGTLQLMIMTAAGFWLLINKLHVSETLSMDTDWFYRKGADLLMKSFYGLTDFRAFVQEKFIRMLNKIIKISENPVYYSRSIINKDESEVEFFNSDIYKSQVGVGVIASLMIFVLFVIIFLVTSIVR
jgi:multicomponent Na+:H+ antiporter subunit D